MLFCFLFLEMLREIGEMRRRIEMGGERDRGREDKIERRVERKEKTKRPSCSRKDAPGEGGGLCIDIILGLGLGV